METKGIITDVQVYTYKNEIKRKLTSQEKAEFSLKGTLVSCFTYGGIEKNGYNFERYILPYKKNMSEKVFDEIYDEMELHFQNCTVNSSVYTDADGSIYNSLTVNN